MKPVNKYIYIFFISVIFFQYSCSNEIDLLAPKKEIPVVYSMLSLDDSIQIVRVERAFQATVSPDQIAQLTDSIYYDNLHVSLNDILLTESMDKDLFPPRDSGFFANTPNRFYYIPSSAITLVAGNNYHLSLKLNDLEIAKSETILISNFSISSPRVTDLLSFDRSNVTFRWTNPEDHYLYDITLQIRIHELSTSINREITLEWPLGRELTSNRFEFDGDLFYNFLGTHLEPIPGLTRSLKSIDLIVLASGKVYQEFINISQQNMGVTGIQSLPNFSNIEGGVGIFGSRSFAKRKSMQVTVGTLELLKSHPSTAPLGF